MELKELLPLLKQYGVTYYRTNGSEVNIQFNNEYKILDKTFEPSTDPVIPSDLKTDDLMSYDSVLNWSGSGDSEPMPLTGEDRLVAP